MGEAEATSRTKASSDDVLPIEAASETDATEELIGMPLKEGHNSVARNRAGLELMVRAIAGSPLEYVIVDSQGEPVDQVVQVRATNKRTRKTTCWECGVDKDGNTHCWKIPCPVIVGPWNPGRVLTRGFVLSS